MLRNKILIFTILAGATLASVGKILIDTQNNIEGSVEQIKAYTQDLEEPTLIVQSGAFGIVEEFTYKTQGNLVKYKLDATYFNRNSREEKIKLISRAQVHYNVFQASLNDLVEAIKSLEATTSGSTDLADFMFTLEEFITLTNNTYLQLAETVGSSIKNNEDILNTEVILINDMIKLAGDKKQDMSELIEKIVVGI